MFTNVPIRRKTIYATLSLAAVVFVLASLSLFGINQYRNLTKDMSALSYEVSEMWDLGQDVAELRSHVRSNLQELSEVALVPEDFYLKRSNPVGIVSKLLVVKNKLQVHEKRLHSQDALHPFLSASQAEYDLIEEIKEKIDRVENLTYQSGIDVKVQSSAIAQRVDEISEDVQSLFQFMTKRMRGFRAAMRSTYHGWQATIAACFGITFCLVSFFLYYFRKNVVHPFKSLLAGSRRIAAGEFDYHIPMHGQDELSELAQGLNNITRRFVEIRNNLNDKVRERTQEVVRSEQLASVGFLAAGVAHEINNPLATIALSAEAMEGRLTEALDAATSDKPDSESASFEELETQIEILQRYLSKIQKEAFRCKGITEKLLDFSRLGESQEREPTDIHESVSDVVELVQHLDQYKNRKVEFSGTEGLIAYVSPTEFKQVVLNLITNSLDASNDGGVVKVSLLASTSSLTLRVSDTGCGMTTEVLNHLFEPFFTRRRDGKGTGLGMSISYRIVQDHGGTLTPYSDGPGKGSKFVLTLPLISMDSNEDKYVKASTAAA